MALQLLIYKQQIITVILAYMADDIKLLAVCIFKFKNILKVLFFQEIHICVNEKKWYNK